MRPLLRRRANLLREVETSGIDLGENTLNIRYLYRQRGLGRMRYITLILGALVAATVIACGSDDDPLPTAVPTTAPQPTVAPQPTSAPAPTDVPAVAAPAAPATGSSAAADLVIPPG